jgi:AraC family transcriptional regulator of adaptative response/methylated-DNA-[protein]-cysteine methyltransferase
MWKAVTQRDKSRDGQFVFAVKTTRVYCRPSCPSRRPNRENVEFYGTTTQALAAGFRACRRCNPDASMSNAEMLVEKVQKYIEDNLDTTVTLEQIGTAIGAKLFHLQRTFKATTGLTPRQYADECRLAAVKKELGAGRAVTDAIYEAGYSSCSRLYETSTRKLGMTPGAYAKRGAGEVISCAFIRSAMGLLLMAATERGLCFLQFGKSESALMQDLHKEFSAAVIVENPQSMTQWIERLLGYFAGREGGMGVVTDIPVDLNGTAFRKAVWHYLRQIPAGETRTYTEVAEKIGRPEAVRAVARACAANRVALVVPCHRVVRQDGGMGGYRWGVERKRELLEQERRQQQDQGP